MIPARNSVSLIYWELVAKDFFWKKKTISFENFEFFEKRIAGLSKIITKLINIQIKSLKDNFTFKSVGFWAE